MEETGSRGSLLEVFREEKAGQVRGGIYHNEVDGRSTTPPEQVAQDKFKQDLDYFRIPYQD